MSKDKASFDRQSAQRIGKATRWVEDQIQNSKPQDRRSVPRTIESNGRYAKITDTHLDGTDEPVIYSWICVEPQPDGSWQEKGEWGKGGPKYTTSVDLSAYFAVDSDNQGTIEEGSIVLIKYLPGYKHVAFQSEQIVRFILTEDMKTLDSTAQAVAMDSTGGQGPATFIVKAKQANKHIYGPAKSGFTGWAYRSPVNQDKIYGSDDKPVYEIIHAQRFARYIEFSADFSSGCQVDATVNYHWDGEDPSSETVKVNMGSYMPCTCFGQITGRAIYDEKASDLDVALIYRVFDINQMLKIYDQSNCPSNYTCSTGTRITDLVVGKGLTMASVDGSCCGKAIELENYLPLAVAQTCDGTTHGDSSTAGSVNAINFEGFDVTVSGDGSCEGTATVSMDLQEGDCIKIEDSTYDCSKTISFDGTIEGGNNVTVTKDSTSCKWRIDADSTIGDTHIVGGDCISVDGTDGTYTIDNDMSVNGGNGVIVSKSGCEYLVSLSGSQGDPLTSISYLCDVDMTMSPISINCVSDGSGGWEFQTSGGVATVTKYYGSFSIPSALLVDATSDCGGSGGSGGGDPPDFTCDDCSDCTSGEQKIMKVTDGTLECDCIDGTASIPNGWTECVDSSSDPVECTGSNITIDSIDCDASPPHFAFTFNSMPSGAESYSITVVGDQGTSATVGPSYNHEEDVGQTYWGALCDGWYCEIPAGECFTMTVRFSDSTGGVVCAQDPVVMCCD